MNVRLKDIAKQVGVSAALVSYVLNNQEKEKGVSKETSLKIRKKALELNYRPNQIAKSLKTNKTHTIGLIVADINYRFTTGVTQAIEAQSKKKHYTVIFGSSEENHKKFSDLVNVLINRQVDGLILVPVEHCENQILDLQKQGIPFVLIDRNIPGIDTNYVGIDNYKPAYRSTLHLIGTGHKRIAFINYKTSLPHLQERTNGYMEALKSEGLTPSKNLMIQVREKQVEEDIKKGIDLLLSDKVKCDAIFFATDVLAIKGLKYINTLNIKVPEQVGILSFDESEAFELFYCPISHGRQPLDLVGRMAVDILIEAINDRKMTKKVTLESDFVAGRSCGEK